MHVCTCSVFGALCSIILSALSPWPRVRRFCFVLCSLSACSVICVPHCTPYSSKLFSTRRGECSRTLRFLAQLQPFLKEDLVFASCTINASFSQRVQLSTALLLNLEPHSIPSKLHFDEEGVDVRAQLQWNPSETPVCTRRRDYSSSAARERKFSCLVFEYLLWFQCDSVQPSPLAYFHHHHNIWFQKETETFALDYFTD